MGVIFVTGIDTGVGKTMVCGLMARAAFDKSVSAATWKPVQTGAQEPEDIREHRRIADSDSLPEDGYGVTCPYLFEKPASPHLAAELEGKAVHEEVLDTSIGVLTGIYDHVIAEGAGGLMVPLTATMTMLDYVKKHNWSLVVVSSGRLGSINHTLLTLNCAKNAGLDVAGVVYNLYPEEDAEIQEDTEFYLRKALNAMYPDADFISLPHVDKITQEHLNSLLELVKKA